MTVSANLSSQSPLFSVDETPSAATERNQTNFVGNMTTPVHRWFRYPAGFGAAWASDTIRQHCAETGSRAIVLDPFAGCGTSILAADLAGIPAHGIESHPFLTRVARAKLGWRTPVVDFEARIADILAHYEPADTDDCPPLLAKCFDSESLSHLLGIRNAVLASDNKRALDDLVWLAFVAIIRPTASAGTAPWQYVLPKKSKARLVQPVDALEQQTRMMLEDMSLLQRQASEVARDTHARFWEADARYPQDVPIQDGAISLAITSPPYANNYDYADSTRLEQTVLGEIHSWSDLKNLREHLVRSCSQHVGRQDLEALLETDDLAPIRDELLKRYKELTEVREQRGGRKAYNNMAVGYFYDLARVWRVLRSKVGEGGMVCFVVGDSAPYGVHLPVERWLGELALSVNFKSWHFEEVRKRNVKWKNRKHRVPLHEGNLWVHG